MTYSVLFRQHHRTLASPVVAVTGVTVLECEPRDLRSRRAPSPRRFSNSQVHQQLQAAAPAQTTGRRIGAGAGATPVFVAMIRPGYLPRSLALTRGSLPHLPLFFGREFG